MWGHGRRRSQKPIRKRYVLLICCINSRWINAIPIPNQKFKTLMDAIMILCNQFEYLERVDSMLKSASNRVSWKRSPGLKEIAVKFATPYHKTTQGLLKRSNKIIEDLLRPSVRDDAKFWNKKLNFLTFAHNQISNRTTGFSPVALIFWRYKIYVESWMQFEKVWLTA